MAGIYDASATTNALRPKSPLNDKDKAKASRMRREGMSEQEIADHFGIPLKDAQICLATMRTTRESRTRMTLNVPPETHTIIDVHRLPHETLGEAVTRLVAPLKTAENKENSNQKGDDNHQPDNDKSEDDYQPDDDEPEDDEPEDEEPEDDEPEDDHQSEDDEPKDDYQPDDDEPEDEEPEDDEPEDDHQSEDDEPEDEDGKEL